MMIRTTPLRSSARGRRIRGALLTTLIGTLVLACGPAAAQPERQMNALELADGFEIEIWADGVVNARGMARSPSGTVYVGSRQKGLVHAVVDEGGRRRVVEIAWDLNMPSGVAFRDGSLYVAEVNRILRYDDIDSRLDNPPQPVVVNGSLPEERHHGWKFIAFSPTGSLFLQVGAPCNVCDVEDPFATILEMDPETGEYEVFARGVRNTVGFDWHPETGDLWFTDNGRDMLGDDLPPDELNRAPKKGLHFGFPFCHAGNLVDPEFGDRGDCADVTQPVKALDPHVAAIGMRFYRGAMFPGRYRGQVFIAEHGSWNRSEPIGYRIKVVHLDDSGQATDYETLVEGWLQGKKAWGRPADVMELPDGSLLISDDLQNVLYRLSYRGGAGSSGAGR